MLLCARLCTLSSLVLFSRRYVVDVAEGDLVLLVDQLVCGCLVFSFHG